MNKRKQKKREEEIFCKETNYSDYTSKQKNENENEKERK